MPRHTELVLGPVHLADGAAGARRRLAAARRFVADYGITAECGFGRCEPATLADLLQIHGNCAGQRQLWIGTADAFKRQ